MFSRNSEAIFLCGIALFTYLSGAVAGPMSTAIPFQVSEMGAASFSIPIQVPPGAGGLVPAIGLTYNSQGNDGLLGVGGGIGGLSLISRCSRNMAQDYVAGGVNLNTEDAFCMDGKRLFPIKGGVAGASGTEYRTEIADFSRIVSYESTQACTRKEVKVPLTRSLARTCRRAGSRSGPRQERS